MTELAIINGGLSQLPAETRDNILNDAINRYGKGESVYTIAEKLGIEHTTLYRHLVKHKGQDWQEAKVSHALAEIELAEQELKSAPDMLALSRARERVRSAQWQLERLLRRLYGQDQPANTHAAVHINIGIAPRAAQVIDAQVMPTVEQSVGEAEQK